MTGPVYSIMIDNFKDKTSNIDHNFDTKDVSHGEVVEDAYYEAFFQELKKENITFSHTLEVQGFDADKNGRIEDEENNITVVYSGNDMDNDGKLDEEEYIHGLIKLEQSIEYELNDTTKQVKKATEIVQNYDVSTINFSYAIYLFGRKGFLGFEPGFDKLKKRVEKRGIESFYKKSSDAAESLQAYAELMENCHKKNTKMIQGALNEKYDDEIENEKGKFVRQRAYLAQTLMHDPNNTVIIVGNTTFGQDDGIEEFADPTYRYDFQATLKEKPGEEFLFSRIFKGNSFATPKVSAKIDAAKVIEKTQAPQPKK